MTKEERAEIARRNGAKSKGPKSYAGKERVSRNALKTGEYAEKFSHFLPPHHVVTCNEDKPAYFALVGELVDIYQPVNQLAMDAVKQIATARWQADRLNHCLTIQWNLAIIDLADSPSELAEELIELDVMAKVSKRLYTGEVVAQRLNRQIDQLELRIARLERRIKFIHANFPAVAEKQPEQTQTENSQPAEKEQPTVYVTENKPEVIRAYKQQFPNHKIVLLAPDDVANGIDIEDDMPVAPRKVA